MERNSIRFAITVCDEELELKRLLSQIDRIVKPNDQVVIQTDWKATNEVKQAVINYVITSKVHDSILIWWQEFPLNGDFAAFKNNLITDEKFPLTEWVFQIDADEELSETMINGLHDLLAKNNEIDLFAVPRVNIVPDVPGSYIIEQRWNMDNMEVDGRHVPVINFPDAQDRIFKLNKDFKWVNKVHEKVTGFKSFAFLPFTDTTWALRHIKSFERQKKQNEFYSTL